MIIARVRDASYIHPDFNGEHLMFFSRYGSCGIISIYNIRSLITSGKTILTDYKFDLDILKLELEIGDNIKKLCEFNSDGEIIFFDRSFLASLINHSEEEYVSLAVFAEKNNISKSKAKKMALDGKIEGVIPIHSTTGRISAYVVPKDAEISDTML